MGRWRAVVTIAVLLAAGGCSGADDSALGGDDVDTVQQLGASEAEAEEASAEGSGAIGEDTAAPMAQAAGPLPQPPPGQADQPPLPPVETFRQDRIIKEGVIGLQVEEGEFDTAYRQVVQTTQRFGGSVLASTTRTTDDQTGASVGSVTVRVPVENYEDLLTGIGGIGDVRRREITAQDVSEEFVDLQSRQRNLEASERFYLELLDRATGVPDAIAVQQQLSGITEQLEQIKGRLQYLEARTSFSTLTVEINEPGTPIGGPAPESEETGPSIGRSWRLAKDAFLNVVGGILVSVSFVAPLVVPVALGFLVWRLLVRKSVQARRRPETEPEPERTPDREPQLTP